MDDESRWFGVFQGHRPNGDGVEEVFAGLPQAAEYVERMRAVCRAALHPDWARDAYFVVRTPRDASDVELIDFGQQLLTGFRLIAVLVTLTGRRELYEYLSGVRDVVVVPAAELNRKHPDQLSVHELLGDVLRGFNDHKHQAVQLREGFYSVACDYWLAWYLQWPYYTEWVPRDVFLPYFELWSRGCEVAFQGQSFRIARIA